MKNDERVGHDGWALREVPRRLTEFLALILRELNHDSEEMGHKLAATRAKMKTCRLFAWLCLLPILMLAAQTKQPPELDFQETYGGEGAEGLTALVPTPDGGFFLVGGSQSKPSGNRTAPLRGIIDVWVIKVDEYGNKVWDRSYSDNAGFVYAGVDEAVATRDGGLIIVGYADTDGKNGGIVNAWILKIDWRGEKIWERFYNGTKDQSVGANAIVAVPTGGYLVLGADARSVTQGGQYWLRRIDENGNELWIKKPKQPSEPSYVDPKRLVPVSGGGWMVGGDLATFVGFPSTVDVYNGYVSRVDELGNRIWDGIFGGNSTDQFYDALPAAEGVLCIGHSVSDPGTGNKTAESLGTGDGWVVKLSSDGTKVSDLSYGAALSDALRAGIRDGDGYIYVGQSSSEPDGSHKTAPAFGLTDYWVIRVSEVGKRVWDLSFGGLSADAASVITSDGSGGYWVGGYSESGISGNKAAGGRGSSDMWVLHLANRTSPTLVAPPKPIIASSGETVLFSVEGRSATIAHRYQWQFNGSDLPGETNKVLRLEKITQANAGSYRVRLTDRFGMAESAPAVLTYTDTPRLGIEANGQFQLFGTPGKRYRIDQSDSLTPPVSWTARTNLVLRTSPLEWREDSSTQAIGARFYRAVLDDNSKRPSYSGTPLH